MSDSTPQHITFNPITYISPAPVYSGHWSIGGTNGMRICLVERPNWFHQKMTYIFIGWKWTDTKESA
jgi:hypothetical protein